MTRFFLPGIALVLSIISLGFGDADERENKRGPSELFAAWKAESDLKKREEIVQEMILLGRPVTEILLRELKKEWEPEFQKYKTGFAATAREIAREKTTSDVKAIVSKLEENVQSLRQRQNLTKEMIKDEGDRAIKELRRWKEITTQEVFSKSEAALPLREKLIALGKEIHLCEDRLILPEENTLGFSEEKLVAYEKQIAREALGIDRSHDAVLKENVRIARAEDVPPAEAEGIRNLNDLRMLIGLPPVTLDPKLCAASRSHSKDMNQHNFFAHDSPIPGRETPWKRAKLAGTTASGENIYHGSSSPSAANRAWYYSPGHHKNMFGNHRRGGMGVDGTMWTQLFGN